jgi:hypothetical protein
MNLTRRIFLSKAYTFIQLWFLEKQLPNLSKETAATLAKVSHPKSHTFVSFLGTWLWLEAEMPPTNLCVENLFSAGGTILGGGGNFRRWSLAGGSRPWKSAFEGYT